MRLGIRCTLTLLCAFVLAGVAAAEPHPELEGTIWFSQEPHSRVTVSNTGEVSLKEGKEIYLQFKKRYGNLYVVDIRWWNKSAGLNVLEHALLTELEPGVYHYVEARHMGPGTEHFPGIAGSGTFELLGEDRAELLQIGHLQNGNVSGFTTILQRVDQLPDPGLDQTYPPGAE
jgi:hypothetical protein